MGQLWQYVNLNMKWNTNIPRY